MITIFLAALLAVAPNNLAYCSFDGHLASATGKKRETSRGIECQYSHIQFKYYQSIFVDEKHVFWQNCEVR
jgi:hypothetical protein